MAYFLRKDKKEKGLYLQIYETFWVKELKQPRSKCIMSIGYLDDLKSDQMPDPIAHYQGVVDDMNSKLAASRHEETRPRAFQRVIEKNVGYYLLSVLIDELDVGPTIDILANTRQFQFSIKDMLSQLIFARVISPCSKAKSVSSVFPSLFRTAPMSEDQVYDGCFFIGESYRKYIELFNHQFAKHHKRCFDRVYFDCTNYYFEIDLPKGDCQKGPSKENRMSPIIGQALLLDAEMIPLDMQMFPGNESEKPHIRRLIEEMKQRCKVTGRTIQIADKGLNCAKNIHAAVVESTDGYIFSKSIHGRNLSEAEKSWILLNNDQNVFTDYYDESHHLTHRLKSCVDTFEYSFKELDPETGEEITTSFSVQEKRVVVYSPKLAAKQKAEILKMAEKASNCVSYKKLAKEELGDAVKYVRVLNKDKNGKKVEPVFEVDEDRLNEDLQYAGYNLLVTSETKMTEQQIYSAYHNLWKIEESFRITKSFLEARPVYVQKKETIYGHFLVCYLSLFLLRVLELKCFKGEISSFELIEFIRDFRVVELENGTFLNISRNQSVNGMLKKLTGNTTLDALYLDKKEIDNLFDSTMLFES